MTSVGIGVPLDGSLMLVLVTIYYACIVTIRHVSSVSAWEVFLCLVIPVIGATGLRISILGRKVRSYFLGQAIVSCFL